MGTNLIEHTTNLRLRFGDFLAISVMKVYLLLLVLEAPTRFYLQSYGLITLAYLPKIVMLLMVLFFPCFVTAVNKKTLFVYVLFCLSFYLGVINLTSPLQALFGLWTVSPIMFAFVFARLFNVHDFRWLFMTLFILVVSGLGFDFYYDFPWDGQDIELIGNSLDISRDWTMMGITRFAGFSRASFNAASQTLVSAIVLMYLFRSYLTLKVCIWMIAFLAIVVTTSKGLIAAWFILTLFYISKGLSRRSGVIDFVWRAITLILVLLVILLPSVLSSIVLDFNPQSANAVLFDSFLDRMINTWPLTFQLMSDSGDHVWFLGRGLGGIGTSQLFFETDLYQPGDNVFIYLMVTFGVPMAIVAIIALVFVPSKKRKTEYYLLLCVPLLLTVGLYGVVNSVMEEAFMIFVFVLLFYSPNKTFQNV